MTVKRQHVTRGPCFALRLCAQGWVNSDLNLILSSLS
jgi:hypothetical protein